MNTLLKAGACAILGTTLMMGAGCSHSRATLDWETSEHRLDPLMPNGIQMNGTAVVENSGGTFAYIIGGNRSTDHGGESTLIHYAPVRGSEIGPWAIADARLVGGGTSYHTRSTLSTNGRIYVVGGRLNMEGDFTTPYNGVRVFTPDASGNIPADAVEYYPAGGDGGVAAAEPPLDLLEMSAVLAPSRANPGESIVYMVGGGLGDEANGVVRSFRINGDTGQIIGAAANGQIAPALTLQRPLPVDVAFAQTILHDGVIYVIGNNPPSTTVFYSRIRNDDTLDHWRVASADLPVPLLDPAAASFNGYVYAIGGTTGTNADVRRSVYRARIDSSTGDITRWTRDADLSLEPGVRRVGATVGPDALFIIGGRRGDSLFTPEVQVGTPR